MIEGDEMERRGIGREALRFRWCQGFEISTLANAKDRKIRSGRKGYDQNNESNGNGQEILWSRDDNKSEYSQHSRSRSRSRSVDRSSSHSHADWKVGGRSDSEDEIVTERFWLGEDQAGSKNYNINEVHEGSSWSVVKRITNTKHDLNEDVWLEKDVKISSNIHEINAADLDGFAAGLVGFDIDGAVVDGEVLDGEAIATTTPAPKSEIERAAEQRHAALRAKMQLQGDIEYDDF